MTVQEICVNIDRSGSMRGKESDTVGGINAMLDALKASKTDEDTIRVSIKLFDHEQIMKTRCTDISEIEEFPVSEFIPRGQTALLDAIGDSLRFFMEKKRMNPTAYDTCLLYVATDGLENASKRHNRDAIKELISNAENVYNIKVIYLGANQNAILEAGNIGIAPTSAINYDETSENVQAVYRGAAAVAYRDRSFPQIAPEFSQMERQSSQPSAEVNYSAPRIVRQTNVHSLPSRGSPLSAPPPTPFLPTVAQLQPNLMHQTSPASPHTPPHLVSQRS